MEIFNNYPHLDLRVVVEGLHLQPLLGFPAHVQLVRLVQNLLQTARKEKSVKKITFFNTT